MFHVFLSLLSPQKNHNQPTATFIDGIRNHGPKVAILVAKKKIKPDTGLHAF